MIINTGSRTDIPAFFSKWFLNRIDEGFICTRNPYNSDIYRYPLDSKIIDCLCFCTKNPKPILNNIDRLDDFNQFWFVTINPYGKDIERNVPDFKNVIKSFKKLSEILGVNKVSWRYDPIFITENTHWIIILIGLKRFHQSFQVILTTVQSASLTCIRKF